MGWTLIYLYGLNFGLVALCFEQHLVVLGKLHTEPILLRGNAKGKP